MSTPITVHLRTALDGRWYAVKNLVRNRVRNILTDEVFWPAPHPEHGGRPAKVADQLIIMATAGAATNAFRKEHGGTGDVGVAGSMTELLVTSDLSPMVKAGVQ